MNIINNQSFENKNSLERAEYNECKFINCDLNEQVIANFSFSECEFDNCNLSNSKIDNSSFKQVKFLDCKLMGINFESVNSFLLKVKFENCQLSYSSFYKLKIPKTKFINCLMMDVDFTEANLTQAWFKDCELANTVFDNTNIEKANFTTASNYSIHPIANNIKKPAFLKKE